MKKQSEIFTNLLTNLEMSIVCLFVIVFVVKTIWTIQKNKWKFVKIPTLFFRENIWWTAHFLQKVNPVLAVMADQSAKQRILLFAKKYKVIDYVIFLSSK